MLNNSIISYFLQFYYFLKEYLNGDRFTVLTSQVLLDRLVARRHYYLSIQIARHLQLPEIEGESRILAHWACYKVIFVAMFHLLERYLYKYKFYNKHIFIYFFIIGKTNTAR